MMLLASSLKIRQDRVSRQPRRILPSQKQRLIQQLTVVGGALGWKTRGGLDPAFEAVAFELEASTVNNPKYAEAKSSFGYHIIMVEGRK